MKYKPDMQRVTVYWQDACSHHHWNDKKYYTKEAGLMGCATTGYLLCKAKDHITIVLNTSENNGIDEGIVIPVGSISRIEKLYPARRAKKH